MQKKISRHNLAPFILLLYFFPVLLYTAYGVGSTATHENWIVILTGVIVSTFGTAVFYTVISHWHRQIQADKQESRKVVGENAALSAPQVIPQSMPAAEPIHAPLYTPQMEQEENKEDDLKHQALMEEVQTKDAELQKLCEEHDHLSQQSNKLMNEIEALRNNLQDTVNSKEKLQKECLKAISDQREIIEAQEQHIVKLENQIRDLNYEIKTLLQIQEHKSQPAQQPGSFSEPMREPEAHAASEMMSAAIPPPLYRPEHAVKTQHTPIAPFQMKSVASPPAIEANLLLKRCIDIAQKITATSILGSDSSRFRDLSVNNYSIDLRRLCDSLRTENANTIILFSQKEDKLLFVNNQAKNLLGWSPEKIVQDFPSILQQGITDWRKALAQLASKTETQLQLSLKTKSGQEVPVQCLLGIIPTGMFRNHVIGVLVQEV